VNPKAVVRVASVEQVRARLDGGPAVFLSASVPYRREPPQGMQTSDHARFVKLNERYLHDAQPARIRSAVLALTRAMLIRRTRLVFGAHPAISPMVLAVAREVQAPPGSILIFQSEFFRRSFPSPTLELASWESGLLVLTGAAPDAKARAKKPERTASLQLMRELMVSVPNLRGAVFVGGMEGVAAEADLFRQQNPGKPMYALASTGSAASELWEAKPKEFAGSLLDPEQVLNSPSYSVVARGILDDLKIESARDGSRWRGETGE